MSVLKNFGLDAAWKWREKLCVSQQSEAYRVFYGPGEGAGDSRFFAIDRFADHYWITEWEGGGGTREEFKRHLIRFLKSQGAQSIVGLNRPEKGVAPESIAWEGVPPVGKIKIMEFGIPFWIQLTQTRHPGLFLDHAPLRAWLKAQMKGLRVLNTFSYTGSLSIAAGIGGASHVTTLDLSKTAIDWAKENWTLNQLAEDSGRFITGDVFDWLVRMKRQNETFDCIVLDPPSFSHGKKGNFSTLKDLEKLHGLAMDLLSSDGFLITSINSANIARKKYESDVFTAAKKRGMKFQIVRQIDLPETFPTELGEESDRYLKGWILRRLS
jgi:23S rRNA (cytosine1962-C5)-methyltransferase